MHALIRAELVKLATTRTFADLVLAAVAVAALGAFSTIVTADVETLGGNVHEQRFFTLASLNLMAFAVVLGIRGFTDDLRHGTMVATLLVAPRRASVVAAKVVALAGAGAVLAIVAGVVMFGVAEMFLTARGAWPSPLSVGGVEALGAADLAAMGGLVAASASWAAMGVALGAIVRPHLVAVGGVLVWIFMVERGAPELLGDASRYLPGQAAHALSLVSQPGALLPPAAAGLVLAAYTVATGTAAMIKMVRAEIAAA